MSLIRKDFDSYKIWYSSGHPYDAHIYCYKEGTYVGRFVFYKDGQNVPPNSNLPSGPSLHYPLSRFNDIVSILRYEKPLYLFLNTANNIGHLATSQNEPVGDQE